MKQYTFCRFRLRSGMCERTKGRCNPRADDCFQNRKTSNLRKYDHSATFTGYIPDKSTVVKEKSIKKKELTLYELEKLFEPEEDINCTDNIPTIRVYNGFLNTKGSSWHDAVLIVDDYVSERTRRLYVAVLFSGESGYYMPNDLLKQYYKQGFRPKINIKYTEAGSEPMNSNVDFAAQSLLSLYGYKVGKSGLPQDEREEILSILIENDIMKSYEILSMLQGFIALRRNRSGADYSDAINDWQSDMDFVSSFMARKLAGGGTRA